MAVRVEGLRSFRDLEASTVGLALMHKRFAIKISQIRGCLSSNQ